MRAPLKPGCAKLWLLLPLLLPLLALACQVAPVPAPAAPAPQVTPAAPVPPAPAVEEPRKGGVLRRYEVSDTGIINGILTKRLIAHYFIYDPLVEYNDRGVLQPALAESWEISPDGRTITFRLRQGVKWHDGQPFTAEDVAFTLDMIKQEGTLTFLRPQLKVAGQWIEWEVVDPLTFRLKLPQPYAPIMGTLNEIGIIPKHLLKDTADINTDPYNRNPVGTGPFKFVRWESDAFVETVANEDYWNGRPNVDRLFHIFFPDADAAAAALLAGEMDAMWAYPEQQPQFEANPQTKVLPYAYWNAITLSFNLKNPALQDKRVRMAIRDAIKSKKEWTDIVTRGRGEVAEVFFAVASPLNQYNPTDVTPHVPNVERAKALLDEAGWRVGPDGIRVKDGMRLSLGSPWVSFLKEYGEGNEIIERWLREVGIEVKAKPVDRALRDELRQKSAEKVWERAMEIQEWPHAISRFEPDMTFELACDAAPPKGNNYNFYCNPEVDRLLEEGRSTFDPTLRARAYAQIQRILLEDVVSIPVYFVFDALVIQDRVKGIPEDSPASRYFFRRFPEKVWVSD